MKFLFSVAVLLLITVPITGILIKMFNPPIWGCFLIGICVGLTVTTLGNKIWDLIKGEET